MRRRSGSSLKDAEQLLETLEQAQEDATRLEAEAVAAETRQDELAAVDADVLTGDTTPDVAARKRAEVETEITEKVNRAARARAALVPLEARVAEAGNAAAEELVAGPRAAFDRAVGEQAAAAEVLRQADLRVEAADADLSTAIGKADELRARFDTDARHRLTERENHRRQQIAWAVRQGTPVALQMIPAEYRDQALREMEERAAAMRETLGPREGSWDRLPAA